MSQERQWTDPVSLGSVNRDYDQGFADGCSESKRLNENLVAAFAQGRAAGLEALDVEVILDTMKQYFSTKESPFGAGGTIVQGGIGSVIEFAHAIRSISPT
ncbi:hypothetical protein NYY60_19265, partial [Acinetobacter baumannii]|nr:hypothetical protein [Acinetobacter baumannii]